MRNMLARPFSAVRLFEVGPRDGLQNQKKVLPPESRVRFVQLLVKAGLKNIEVGSFVRPDWVPSMKDSDKVLVQLNKLSQYSAINFSSLVPNQKGFEQALACGAKEIAIFISATEGFSKKNLNCSIEESIKKSKLVIESALSKGIRVRGYISMVLGCPYDGQVDPRDVAQLTRKLLELGVYEVSLGDTIAKGQPQSVKKLLDVVAPYREKVAMHFHDTSGNAVKNIIQSYKAGFTNFDSACGGLGGCPYSKSPKGNVATEHVVQAFNELGVQTGVDLGLLKQAARYVRDQLSK